MEISVGHFWALTEPSAARAGSISKSKCCLSLLKATEELPRTPYKAAWGSVRDLYEASEGSIRDLYILNEP